MPRLSVVIPAFNNADFIDEAVSSVLRQDHDDFELVVADHSSSDDTAQKLQAYEGDKRVRLLSTPAGGGAEANWRRVTEAATGAYVKLLPGDDVLYPGALRAQSDALDANPGVVLVSSKRDILDAGGAVTVAHRGLQGVRMERQKGVEVLRQTVRRGTNVFGEPGSVMMNRDLLQGAGGWEARFPYLIDQFGYAKVLLQGDYLPVNQTLGGFRVNAAQWSIALVGQQAAQVRDFHEWCHEQVPDSITSSDVWLGNRRAEAMALARRAYYTVYKKRLQAA